MVVSLFYTVAIGLRLKEPSQFLGTDPSYGHKEKMDHKLRQGSFEGLDGLALHDADGLALVRNEGGFVGDHFEEVVAGFFGFPLEVLGD